MNILRSIAFNIIYLAGSLVISLIMIWTFFLPQKYCTRIVSDIYGGYMSWIEKHVMGLKLKIKGREHLPKGTPYIIAAKHQSAFETLKIPFMKEFHYPVIILKRELTWLPLWGMYPLRMGHVPIDRGAGMTALSSISRGCKRAIDNGRNVVIFPQGTRVAAGAVKPYKTGIAKIYKDLGVPIVPMALNSGVFWGRNAFFKKAGTVTFEFLPLIPPGLPPLKMMEQLEKVLEEASDRLVTQVGGPALKK